MEAVSHRAFYPDGHYSTRYLPIDIDWTLCQQHKTTSMETSNGRFCAIFRLEYRSPHSILHGAFEVASSFHAA
jgi:hypothetical protein